MALEDLARRVNGPAPTGLQQQQGGSGPSGGGQGGLDGLRSRVEGGRQPRWNTGGARYGTENGWNTDFVNRMIEQQNRYADEGKSGTQLLQSKDFTGVITVEDAGNNRKWGDIYDNGVYQGNVFKENDSDSAYQLMGRYMLSAGTQKKTYEQLANDPGALRREVDSMKQSNTKNYKASESQGIYETRVDDLKDEWDDDATSWAAIGAGAAGGAGIGAGIGAAVGSLFFGAGAAPGAAIGAGIGGLVGAIGGGMNRDALEDQAARASVQTGLAAEEFGLGGAVSTGLRQWGGASMSAISPLTNLVQGAFDDVRNDHKVGWYEEERPMWQEALGFGATLGDSLLQFASPVGRGAFMTGMTLTTAGGVGQLATQDMATFDDRRGEFHSPEDAGQAAAAIGAVGIDAIQLFGIRGLTRSAESLNRAGGTAVNGVRETAGDVFNPSLARKQADNVYESGGRKFTLDADGNATVRKIPTISILAPSEMVQYASVRAKALRMDAAQRNSLNPESMDNLLYRATRDLENGTNLMEASLINGFGEGLEEATQAVLEPLSHGWTPEWNDIASSYMQGLAAGFGMSVGNRLGRANRDDRMFTTANLNAELNNQPQLTKDQWRGMSILEKERLAATTPQVEKMLTETAKKTADQWAPDLVMSTPGLERIMDARTAAAERQMKSLNPNQEGTYKIVAMTSVDDKAHWLGTDAKTVGELLTNRLEALQTEIETLPAGDDRRATLEATFAAGDKILRDIFPKLARINEGAADARQLADEVNAALEAAWADTDVVGFKNSVLSPATRFVSTTLSRDPNDNSGSYLLGLPHVKPELNGTGLIQTNRSAWKAMGADADGDNMRHRLRLDNDETLVALRLGQQYLSTFDGSPTTSSPEHEAFIINRLGLDILGGAGGAMEQDGKAAIGDIVNNLKKLLDGYPHLDDALNDFSNALRVGDPDAVPALQARLAQEPDAVMALSQEGNKTLPAGSNIMFEVARTVNRGLHRYKDLTADRRTTDARDALATADWLAPTIDSQDTVRQRIAIGAATKSDTQYQEYVGTDRMRIMQKSYYSLFRSAEWNSGDRTSSTREADQFSEYYALINSLMSRPGELEVLGFNDEIVRGALRMLEVMADGMRDEDPSSRPASYVVAASLQMPNYIQSESGFQYHGETTVAQYALQQSIAGYRARYGTAIAVDEALARKVSALESAAKNPATAIVELFNFTPMEHLVGEAALTFGKNQTFGQVYSSYLNKDVFAREREREMLNLDGRVKGRHDFPYSVTEVRDGSVNDLKVIAGALFEAAGQELHHNPRTGEISGSLVDRDNALQEKLEAGLQSAMSAVKRQFGLKRGFTGRKVEDLHRILNQNPDFGRQVFQLLPDELVEAVLTLPEDGSQIYVPRWFSEMLLAKSPKEAAMTYFRNTLLAQINVYNADNKAEPPKDRLVAMAVALREDANNPLRFNRFTELLLNRSTVQDFLTAVNQEFISGPPQLAWHRETARFDPSLSNGGWDMSLDGALWRAAIERFNNGATRFDKDSAAEEAQVRVNEATLAKLWEAHKAEKAGRPSSSSAAAEILDRRLDAVMEMPNIALGPGALLRAGTAVAELFSGNATDKGAVLVGTEHLGDAANRNAATPDIGYEQGVAAMTSVDSVDVAGNPRILAGDSIRITDEFGNTVLWEWPADKVARREKFLQLYSDPKNWSGMNAILFPTAFEYSHGSGRLEQRMLTDMNLATFLNNDVYGKMTVKDGAPALQYAGVINAMAEEFGGDNAVLDWAASVANAWIHGSSRELSPEDVETTFRDALFSVVNLMRAVGRRGDSAEALQEVSKAVAHLRSNVDLTGLDKDTAQAAITALEAEFEVLPESNSEEDIARAQSLNNAVRQYLRGDEFSEAIRRFAIDWADSKDVEAKKKMMYRLVQDNPIYASATGGKVLPRLLRPTVFDDAEQAIPVLSSHEATDKELWDTVSREILGLMRDEATSAVMSRVQSATPPESILKALNLETTGQLERSALGLGKFWDQDYSFILEPLLDETSPVSQAVRKFHQLQNRGAETSTAAQGELSDVTAALLALSDPKKLGRWTSDFASRASSSSLRLLASPARRQIGRGGMPHVKPAAISRATARTYVDPQTAGVSPRTYTVDAEVLDLLLNPPEKEAARVDVLTDEVLLPAGDKDRPESLVTLNGRFFTNAKLHYVKDGQSQEIDLLRDPSLRYHAGSAFYGPQKGRGTDYFTSSSTRLVLAAKQALPEGATNATMSLEFWHPEDQPAGKEFANNLYFEGTAWVGPGDMYNSLMGAEYLGNEGFTHTETEAALKIWKKPKGAAIRNPKLPGADEIRDLEVVGDLYGTLHRKALRMMQLNLKQDDALNPLTYSFVMKDLKTRHGIRAIIGDQVRYYSAEEAIAAQRAGQVLEGEQQEIVTLSSRTLRTLLNDSTGYTLPGRRTADPALDTADVETWEGDLHALITRYLPDMLTVQNVGGQVSYRAADITETAIFRRSQLSQMTGTAPLSKSEQKVRTEGIERDYARLDTIRASRKANPEFSENTFGRAYKRLQDDVRMLQSMPYLALQDAQPGLPIQLQVGIDQYSDKRLAELVFKEIRQVRDAEPLTAGFIVRHALSPRNGDRTSGVIHGFEALDSDQPAHTSHSMNIARGDLGILELTGFPEDEAEFLRDATKYLDRMVKYGMTIGLTEEGGTNRALRDELADILEARGYTRVAETKLLWRPAEVKDRQNQTFEARMSRLTEVRALNKQNHVLSFFSPDLPIDENMAYINKIANKNGREVLVSSEMAPTTAWGSFNVASQEQRRGVKQQLQRIARSEKYMEHLFNMSVDPSYFASGTSKRLERLSKEERAKAFSDFRAAMVRAAVNYDERTGLDVTGSERQPGDFIILTGPAGQLIFARQGFEALKDRTALRAQLSQPIPADVAHAMGDEFRPGPGGVAVYSPLQNPNATTHRGVVHEWQPTSDRGYTLVQRIPLQELGNKVALERNGLKLIGADMTDSGVELPGYGPLKSWEIDYLVNMADVLSKESTDGLVNNARNGIGYVGMDFTQSFVQVFIDPSMTAEKWVSLTPVERSSYRTSASDRLSQIRESGERRSPAQLLAIQRGVLEGRSDGQTILQDLLESPLLTSLFPDLYRKASADLQANALTPEQIVAMNMALYMMIPGAHPSHVLSAAGFDGVANETTGVTSILMPEIFTRIFDQAARGSDLRNWFFQNLNRRVNRDPQGGTSSGYFFRDDWTFVIRNEDPSKSMEGYLSFSEAVTTGDNPVGSAEARTRSDSESHSLQYTKVAEQALATRVFHARELKPAKSERQETIASETDLFSVLHGKTVKNRWSPQTPTMLNRNTMQYQNQAMEKRKRWQTALNTSDLTEDQKAEFNRMKVELGNRYFGWTSDSTELNFFDQWVRQWNAAPKERNAQTLAEEGPVAYDRIRRSLQIIEKNLNQGLLPMSNEITAGVLPAHTLSEITLLHRAANSTAGVWELKGLSTLDEYAEHAIGLMRVGGDAAFDLDLDGFFHTYQYAGEGYQHAAYSLNDLRAMALLTDGDTLSGVSQTLDPNNPVDRQAAVYDTYNASITGLIEGNLDLDTESDGVRDMRRWRKKTGAPEQTTQNLQSGRSFLQQGAFTTSTVRTLLNVRGALVMSNPVLWLASFPELAVRNTLEGATMALTGRGGWAEKINKNMPELKAARAEIISTLANDKRFRAMVNKEITNHQPYEGMGRPERASRKWLEWSGRMQDGSYGIPARSLATRYVDQALYELGQTGGSMKDALALINTLRGNPEALSRAGVEGKAMHDSGIKAIARIRSLSPTVGSIVFRGILDPLANSTRPGVNLLFNLGAKMPLMFLPFALNLATNALGLQGLNSLAAVALQGKHGGKKFSKLQARLQGLGDNVNENVHGIDFIDEALESVNLAHSFVKAGLTHTSLIGLAALSGSLGLSGEDEEEKRRRRAAEVQGIPWIYDPRRLENDWRNADAIFLDNLPDWFPFRTLIAETFEVSDADSPGGQTSMANLHWALKMYFSPMMGIERFADTGDWRHVMWGFQDAVGEMPLVNAGLFDDAANTAQELYSAAESAEASGNPEQLGQSYGFLLNAVMTYERMLLESSFVNSLYVASDKYDRDPWTLPDIGADGKITRDDTGVPMTTEALNQYLNADGEVAEGKITPNWFEGQMRTVAEGKLTFALMANLFSGFKAPGDSGSFLRYDQAVKEHKIEKTALSTEDAANLVMSLWDEETASEIPTLAGGAAVMRGLKMGTLRPDDPALKNIYLSYEQRQDISEYLIAELIADKVAMGLDVQTAEKLANEVWWGSKTNPYATPLWEVVWSKGEFEGSISYSPVARYRQLNTTYVMGPDGRPYATGIARDKLNNFWGLAPLQRFQAAGESNMDLDSQLNSVDVINEINTGMRGLEKPEESWANPTDEDILAAVEDGFKKVTDAIKDGSFDDQYGSYGGYSRGGRSGYGGGSGGGGGSYSRSFTPYRLSTPERNNATYGSNDPYIRANDPNIRRADIRRERYSSTRGRLNQWQ